MTTTTMLGSIGKWAGLGAGILATAASQLPLGKTTTYLAGGAGILSAIAHFANGEGNRHSMTGSPQQ